MKASVTTEDRTVLFPQKNESTPPRGAYGEGTHKVQRGVWVFVVFPREVTATLVRFTLGLIGGLSAGAADRSEEGWKEE